MTYDPHYRITMSGTLPGSEIFSMNFAVANGDEEGGISALLDFQPNGDVWDDILDACVAWFGRADTGISERARLKMVKAAVIGENGLYAAAPTERATDTP